MDSAEHTDPPANSGVTIKQEPIDDTLISWKFKPQEKINLLSDDEGEDDQADLQAKFTADPSGVAEEAIGHISEDQATTEQAVPDSARLAPSFDPENVLDVQQLAKQRQKLLADKFRSRQPQPAAVVESNSIFCEHDDTEIAQAAPKPKGRGKQGRTNNDAAARFQKAKQQYTRKKKAATLSLEEEIEFMRLESMEGARRRKEEADLEFDMPPSSDGDLDDGLFIDENMPDIPSYTAMYSDDEDAERPKRRRRQESDDECPRKRNKPKAAAKKGKNVAGQGYTEDDFDDVIKKAKQKTKNDAPKKAKSRGGKKSGPSMTNLGSILGTDVFGDTAKNAGLAQQPTFEQQGRRAEAMKQLIASVPEEDMAVAKSDKKYLDDAIKAFTGQASVKPAEDGHWRLQGMRTTLKHYQILGVAFMRRRENSDQPPKGGILADQMGLGKTIMMLANIVNGKPKSRTKQRATLIVASPALVKQWTDEIATHTISKREDKQHGIGRVIQFRSGTRIACNDAPDLLEEADIVLTTYHEVAKSYPKAVVPSNLVTAAQKDEWWRAHYEENKGLLHRVRWLRVVLDEAHAIKNHKGHTSMGCRSLESRFYWAVTGTPILNTVKEFYPYFKENFCSPNDPEGSERLNVFLRKFMIRRTHLDTLFNARLLDLPQPREHTLWLEFNEIERNIYEIVKKRFIQRINTISQQGGLEKQYNHIWSMILRLRQITCHVLMVQGTVLDLLEREDFEKLNNITESEEEMSDEGTALLLHLRSILKNNVGVKSIEGGIASATLTETESLHTGIIDIDNTEGDTGGKHGLSYRFRKYLDSLVKSKHWEVITQRTLCCGCRQPPENPHVTSCFHIFCFACLKDLQHLAARRGHDQARCSECGEAYSTAKPCEGIDTFQARETSTSTTDAQPAKKSTKPKKGENGMQNWITEISGEVLPSSKTQAVKAQIMNWKDEEKGVKIIIYTQFLDMIRILAKVCQTEKWAFAEYTGKMSHDSRDKAIHEFGSNPEKNILLASLKCGGLGLNLTMASRVLQIDPYWNAAVEQQAFCRVFRIGQDKETRLCRLVVRNTIDAAMMAMKDRKQAEIDEVMNDPKRKEKLSVKDLMRLFGSIGEDEEGRPFIFPEGADPEHTRLAALSEDEEPGNEP